MKNSLFLCLLFCSSELALSQEKAKSPRRFVDILQVGAIVSYSSPQRTTPVRGMPANAMFYSPTNFSLTIYTPDQQEAIRQEYEQKLGDYDRSREEYTASRVKNAALNAKETELRRQIGPANEEEQLRIRAELDAISILREEMPRLPRPNIVSRPRQTTFYRVSEIGEDFICIERPGKQVFIPLWSIRAISRDLPKEVKEQPTVTQEAAAVK